MVAVRIYVEGGGDQRATLAECRRGFSEFFRKVVPGRSPRVVPCGGRNAAFDRFRTALCDGGDATPLLLVDSEAPVAPAAVAASPASANAADTSRGGQHADTAGRTAWDHLKRADGWERPAGASDEAAHLMVQCMEAWLLADRDALARFYGQGFHAGALPGQADVEAIAKQDVLGALAKATRGTKTKGEYHKTRHGFDLLALVDPGRVVGASRHARRLVETIAELAVRAP
ncbi:MAG: DUF4276 family protein [Myxococcota bacterium]|nr:DUF4276 family protein [Myxococcota bacterium]